MNNPSEYHDYLNINRKNWNERVEPHFQSEFYGVEEFVNGKNSLNEIELNLLGELKGKSLLHLQCHFGQDSISLSRKGAKVTGIDFSEKAIEKAVELNKICNTSCHFVCSDVYSSINSIEEKFDIVFTSYGTIGWLPDLNKWAEVIANFLKPEGKFIMADFHPVVWMFDNDFNTVAYNYSKDAPIVEVTNGTYADRNAQVNSQTISWNHGIGEILTALIENNLEITVFQEEHYSPYNCFNGMTEIKPGKFIIEKLGNKVPLVFSLTATKK